MYNKNNIKTTLSKNKIIPALYIVSTPIGNKNDITLRAIEVLKLSNIIICEDTRVSKNLFKLLNISIRDKKWVSYNDFNGSRKIDFVLGEIEKNKTISLVSDAGTPLISDPGYKLIKKAREKKKKVYPIPGVSSAVAALTASGLKTDKFSFIGFLPKNINNSLKILKEYSKLQTTLIVYEKSTRLDRLLKLLRENFTSMKIVCAREITKIYEEYIEINTLNIDHYINNGLKLKGEVTILIEFNKPMLEKKITNKILLKELKSYKPSQVSTMLSKITDESRESIYKRCIALIKNEKI